MKDELEFMIGIAAGAIVLGLVLVAAFIADILNRP
jgi:hypothetical protein